MANVAGSRVPRPLRPTPLVEKRFHNIDPLAATPALSSHTTVAPTTATFRAG
jgi:hypothetical protein